MSARKALAVAKWAVSAKDERRLREVTAKHKNSKPAKDDNQAVLYNLRPGERRAAQRGLGQRW